MISQINARASKPSVLFLGTENSLIWLWLCQAEQNVLRQDGPINVKYILSNEVYFIVSHGYRYRIQNDVLEAVRGNVVNLHISYLPWNKGADPNFWSFIEKTPKGVSIHRVDENFDTGDVLLRKQFSFSSKNETLASSYEFLQKAILELFILHWPDIKNGRIQGQKQSAGSSHKKKDKEPFLHLLSHGWNTPVAVLENHRKEPGCFHMDGTGDYEKK